MCRSRKYEGICKTDGKTKNDYFQDMLAEVLAWGLEPAVVTGDAW